MSHSVHSSCTIPSGSSSLQTLEALYLSPCSGCRSILSLHIGQARSTGNSHPGSSPQPGMSRDWRITPPAPSLLGGTSLGSVRRHFSESLAGLMPTGVVRLIMLYWLPSHLHVTSHLHITTSWNHLFNMLLAHDN